jgi:hypothetical protein
MAINPQVKYSGKVTPGNSDYPYGSARNVTTPNDGTGTPWDDDAINDVFGFQQALLGGDGIVPSGNAETSLVSQYMQGLEAIIKKRMRVYANTGDTNDISSKIGGIVNDGDISRPYSPGNLVTGGPWRNCCRGYNPVTRNETAYFLEEGETTYIVSVENRLVDFQQIQTNLPITLPANHVPDSICSDGNSVYILCHTAASGTAAAVHRFYHQPSWSSTPTWSTTLTGAINDSRDGSSVIKVADGLRIAVLYNGAELTGATNAIGILLKSTGAETAGNGSHVPTSNMFGGTGLCVAGGYVWFTT